jgi:hypothetical protein
MTRTRLREPVAKRHVLELDAAVAAAEDAGLIRVVDDAQAHGARIYPA